MEQIRISVNKDSPKTHIYYIFVHIFRLQESFLEAKILSKAIKLHFCTSEQKKCNQNPAFEVSGRTKQKNARPQIRAFRDTGDSHTLRFVHLDGRKIRARCATGDSHTPIILLTPIIPN